MGKALIGFAITAAALLGQTGPVFEVASIKPAAPLVPAQVVAGKMHVGMKVDGAQVDIGFMSLADLLRTAYRVKAYQISGPDWMRSERFDILAKLPEGNSPDQVPEMLQALLAERFKLAIHHESKEQPVYALVVGKNGPKLKESAPDADSPVLGGPAPDAANAAKSQFQIERDGKGVVVKGSPLGGAVRVSVGQSGAMRLESSKMTLAAFTEFLTPFVDRPVVDMTGLKGTYQIALDLSMDEIRNLAGRAGVALPGAGAGAGAGVDISSLKGQPGAPVPSDPAGSSIFQSVEQLGLKLEPRKASVDVIVVDHLEKTPTEN